MIKTKIPQKDIPLELSRYLSATATDALTSASRYIDRGAELITPDAVEALRRLVPAVHKKESRLDPSSRFGERLNMLTTYFLEASDDGHAGTPAHRETVFALLYFLKGFDRIPDSIPEIGLLDDALIVDAVLHRNETVMRAHWLRNGRPWPLDR